MSIFIPIKQVPDTETKVRLNSDKTGLDLASVKWVINPYDEFALEEGLRLKEKTQKLVKVITVGPMNRTKDSLITALAMGADEAISVDSDKELDSFLTAQALKLAIEKEGDISYILTGKSGIDHNMSSVSQMLAEFLNLPHVTVVSKIDWAEGICTVTRDVEGGKKEIFEVKGPAVLGATKGLNTPRYASLPGIMKAKKKPMKQISLSDLGVGEENKKISFSHFELPAERAGLKNMEGTPQEQVNQLVDLLKNEAKVL